MAVPVVPYTAHGEDGGASRDTEEQCPCALGWLAREQQLTVPWGH